MIAIFLKLFQGLFVFLEQKHKTNMKLKDNLQQNTQTYNKNKNR